VIKLDSYDLKILSAVQRDGRISKSALAEAIGLSPSPSWTRLKRLEEAGVIAAYQARISLRTIAPFAAVFVEVTLKVHKHVAFQHFEERIKATDEIVSCDAVGGGIDYMLKVVTRDIDSYQRLIDRLLEQDIGIDRYFSYIVTRAVKEDSGKAFHTLLNTTSLAPHSAVSA
jgi:Lrp/AsnC family transcriptional regulator of ectoine degradation